MAITDDTALQAQITEAVRQTLSAGEALQCTRDWSAWLYKTMTDEDFTDASDGPLVDEVAAAVLSVIHAEVKRAQAQAWRKGHMAGFEDSLLACEIATGIKPGPLPGPTSNPYRTEQNDGR